MSPLRGQPARKMYIAKFLIKSAAVQLMLQLARDSPLCATFGEAKNEQAFKI